MQTTLFRRLFSPLFQGVHRCLPLRLSLRLRPSVTGVLLGLCLWLGVMAIGHAQTGDSIPTAKPLGELTTELTVAGSVTPASPDDYYRFTVAGQVREVTATLLGASLQKPPGNLSGVVVALVEDANGDGLGEELIRREGYYGNDFSISLWLDPGTYFLRISQASSSADTAYEVKLQQTSQPNSPGRRDNSLNQATPLATSGVAHDYVGNADPVDFHRFEVVGAVTEVHVSLQGISTINGGPARFTSVQYSVVRDANHDGVEEVLASLSSVSPASEIVVWLDPGTYYVRVDSPDQGGGDKNAYYDLSLSRISRPESPGNGDNDFSSARLWGTPGVPVLDFVGENDLVDYYLFSVDGPAHEVTATVVQTRSGFLAPPSVDVAILSGNQELVSGTTIFGNDLTIRRVLNPGRYLARVRRSGGGLASANNAVYQLGLGGVSSPTISVLALAGDLAFGSVPVGSTATRALILRNDGNVSLTVSNLVYPAGFSGPYAGTIPARGRAEVQIAFAPSAQGNFGSIVRVVSDATTGVSTIPISGAGTPVPTRVIQTSSSVRFGDVEVNSRSVLSLPVRNAGNSPLTISGLVMPLGFSSEFFGVIAPGATVVVPIAFAPTNTGAFSGSVAFLSDATAPTSPVSVLGNGVPEKSRILGLIGNLAFGGVESGQRLSRGFVLTNSGEASLTVIRLRLPPGFLGAFSGVIEPRQWRSVVVTFAPTSEGSYGGLVNVEANHNGGTAFLPISGTGTPVLSRLLQIDSPTFGSIPAHSRATNTLVLWNRGVAAITVREIILPFGFSGNFSGVIPPGESRRVLITFRPEEGADYTGTLAVVSDANAGSNSALIIGHGLPAPLAPVPGTYAGLFRADGDAPPEASGGFTIQVDTRGGYSAVLRMLGRSISMSGKFAFDGTATNVVVPAGLAPVTLIWQADPDLGRTITGTVSSAGWQALLSGFRATPVGGHPPLLAGTYTLVVPGAAGSQAVPEGAGIASVTVATNGQVSLVGQLADGSKFSVKSQLSTNGTCPFTLLSKSASVVGWLTFGQSSDRDVAGELHWQRLAAASTKPVPYRDGFDLRTDVYGLRYAATKATAGVGGETLGRIELSAQDLPASQTATFEFNLKNQLSVADARGLTLKLNAKTGLLTGKLTPPAPLGAIAFQTILLQTPASHPMARGFFLHTGFSGSAKLDFE